MIGFCWLALVVSAVHTLHGWLTRRLIRRSLNTLTGIALIGFADRLAADAH